LRGGNEDGITIFFNAVAFSAIAFAIPNEYKFSQV